ncbi:MAG: chaperone modulator CbpM [bacterium]
MKTEKDICDALFFHREHIHITLRELKEVSMLTSEEIQELVEFGILRPIGNEPDSWLFTSHCMTLARRALRLKKTFDLKPAGLALALIYQEKIRELEKRIHELECYLEIK